MTLLSSRVHGSQRICSAVFVHVGAMLMTLPASAVWTDVDFEKQPVAAAPSVQVAERAPSLLPVGKRWRLVWNDEFDGRCIDTNKWMCRESFWGYDFPAFSHDFEGVEVKDGTLRLHLLRKGDDFVSPHLQTGSLTFDVPKDSKGFWPFGARRKPLFMHKYGYYEIRCRQPRNDGWHSAFWLQAPGVGSHPDPRQCGVETDIMENYLQFTEGNIVGGIGWNGYGKESKWYGHVRWKHVETADRWHYYGCDWSPDGYVFYCDGREIGRQDGPVSDVEQFILVSTEAHGYRNDDGNDGGLSASMGTKTWGKPDPKLFKAVLPDFFEVDFVRVYDSVR